MPKPRAGDVAHARRQDADDPRLTLADPHRAPDDARVGAEDPLPGLVGEQQRARRAGRAVLGREVAAQQRLHAEDREHVVHHQHAVQRFGLVLDERQAVEGVDGHLAERRVAIAPVEVVRGTHDIGRIVARNVVLPDLDQPVGPLEGERRVEHRREHRRDGGGGADAETEGQHGGKRVQRLAGEAAQRVANILGDAFESGHANLVTGVVGNASGSSHPAQRFEPGLFRRRTTLLRLGGGEREVMVPARRSSRPRCRVRVR